jgi:predicted lactoylglutathione lyase
MANHKLFVNLPVKDVAKAKSFYTALGFTLNPQFSDDTTGCVVLSPDLYVMLLSEPKFQGFSPRPLPDPRATTGMLLALSCDSRDQVQALCEAAFAAGGRKYKEAQDHGFMYAWGFEDPDGHVWEPVWMDPAHVQG